MLDRMGESPLLRGWTTCPRCRHELEREEKSVSCPTCGLAVYANPAPTASGLVLDEEGEEPLAALRREIDEETSLEIEPVDFLGGFPDRYGADGIHTLNFYWTARITGGELELDDDELAEVAWFHPEELPDPAEFAFRNTLEALEAWRGSLGSAGGER
jgi:ADP-ribose pyrophosphatase YjhB (NUDIX family)